MATLRLENITHQAVPSALVLRVAEMEAPEDWHLAGVGRHGLDKGPNKHDEEYVENGQHGQDFHVV